MAVTEKYLRVEQCKKLSFRELIPRNDPLYKRVKRTKCRPPGTYSAAFKHAFPDHDEPNFSKTNLQAGPEMIDKIADMIEDDLLGGARFDELSLAKLGEELCDELLRRQRTFKRDHLRLDYYGTYFGDDHPYVSAPGIAKIWINYSEPFLTCDDNFTTSSLRPIIRFAVLLKTVGQRRDLFDRYAQDVLNIVAYFNRTRWHRLIDPIWANSLQGGTSILEYLGFSWRYWTDHGRIRDHKRPMHNNGLAEYGNLLLSLCDFYQNEDEELVRRKVYYSVGGGSLPYFLSRSRIDSSSRSFTRRSVSTAKNFKARMCSLSTVVV